MTTTPRRLTPSERVVSTSGAKAALRCQALVQSGVVQCDRCNHPAQTAAFSAGEVDCVCFDCFPAYIAETTARARALAPLHMAGV